MSDTLANGHVPGTTSGTVDEDRPLDPATAEAMRVVRVVEERFGAAQDRTSHIVLGKGVVFGLGVGLVLATGFVVNDLVHTVVADLAANL